MNNICVWVADPILNVIAVFSHSEVDLDVVLVIGDTYLKLIWIYFIISRTTRAATMKLPYTHEDGTRGSVLPGHRFNLGIRGAIT
jgi:hypothetical protein